MTRVASGETTRVDVQYGGYRGRIAGRVLDESGAGVENVWVQAKPADAQGDPFADMQQLKLLREGRRALSDVEGRFELHGLAESGTFVVTAQWPLGGEAKVEGVRAGGAIDLLLQALGSLSGTAVNAEGQPVVQLSLQLSNAQTGQQRAEVLFAPGGQWRIDNVTPGPLQLIANDPHRNVAMASWTLSPKQKLTGLRLEFRPAEAHAANSVADE